MLGALSHAGVEVISAAEEDDIGLRLAALVNADGALDLPAEEVDGKVLQLGKRRFARVRVR